MSTHAPTSPAEDHSDVTAGPPPQSVTLNAAFAGVRRVPTPVNEPTRTYVPGSPERAELKARLTSMAAEKVDIPIVIGGREIRTGQTHDVVMPHNHGHALGTYHSARPEHIQQAINAALSVIGDAIHTATGLTLFAS